MIIVMRGDATSAEESAVVARIKEYGCQDQINRGAEMTVIGVFGAETGKIDPAVFEVLAGVSEVKRIEKPYKAASRRFRPQDSIVDLGNGVKVGGNNFLMVAGPCSVESYDQAMACADFLVNLGIKAMRGGVFKPRTSPHAFQGLGLEGLRILQRVKEKTGLLMVSEIMSPDQILPAEDIIDVYQVGARQMQTYDLLRALAKTKKPVVLKRGLSAYIESEWLCAADYLLNGNDVPKVVLCERGIRTFEPSMRSTLDLGAVVTVKACSHLPVIVDPSHAAGNFRYVPDLAKAAVAVGSHGLMIEIHPDPKTAKSDGPQSLTFSDFARLYADIKTLVKVMGKDIV